MAVARKTVSILDQDLEDVLSGSPGEFEIFNGHRLTNLNRAARRTHHQQERV